MKTNKPSKKPTAKPSSKHRSRRWWVWIIGACLLLLAGLTAVFAWAYNGRALPNVTVGESTVSAMGYDQIRPVVQQQQAKLSITFATQDAAVAVPAAEVGVEIDVDATVRQALQARRSGNLWQNVQLWQPLVVPLVLNNDAGKAISYAKQHFPAEFVDAKEPKITYNSEKKQFDLQPGEPGKGFDIKAFEHALPELARHPGNITLPVTTAPTSPIIQTESAAQAQKTANQRLQLSLQFKLADKVIYTAEASDIANWIHFEPNATKGTFDVTYDAAKVQQFLTDRVGSAVATPPIERKVIVDPQTGFETVLQDGKAGQQLSDIDSLSNKIVNALDSNQSLTETISIVEAPFKTVTLAASDKWIEVDLSRQRATLYAGNTAIQSFLISSGKARTPTRIGTFHIWYKTPSQTMTGTIAGDYFYLPNVKWVSYFDGDEAFHGTYWHSNFGYPMSHGCVNMTEADAKVLYDFAPVGTRVVVHT